MECRLVRIGHNSFQSVAQTLVSVKQKLKLYGGAETSEYATDLKTLSRRMTVT